MEVDEAPIACSETTKSSSTPPEDDDPVNGDEHATGDDVLGDLLDMVGGQVAAGSSTTTTMTTITAKSDELENAGDSAYVSPARLSSDESASSPPSVSRGNNNNASNVVENGVVTPSTSSTSSFEPSSSSSVEPSSSASNSSSVSEDFVEASEDPISSNGVDIDELPELPVAPISDSKEAGNSSTSTDDDATNHDDAVNHDAINHNDDVNQDDAVGNDDAVYQNGANKNNDAIHNDDAVKNGDAAVDSTSQSLLNERSIPEAENERSEDGASNEDERSFVDQSVAPESEPKDADSTGGDVSDVTEVAIAESAPPAPTLNPDEDASMKDNTETSSSASRSVATANPRSLADLSSTISQLAARVSSDKAATANDDDDDPIDDGVGDVSMEDDEEDEEEEEEEAGEDATASKDNNDETLRYAMDVANNSSNNNNSEGRRVEDASSAQGTGVERMDEATATNGTAPASASTSSSTQASTSYEDVMVVHDDDDDDDVQMSAPPPLPPPAASTPEDNKKSSAASTSSSFSSSRPCLTKEQITSIIEQKFRSYVKNLCKTDELETRFAHLEEWTENLRKKHREQDKTLMKIERSARVGDRRAGCRHVACQTNLGGGSLQAAQKMSQRSGTPGATGTGRAGPASGAPARPNLNATTNNNKRSQEVVDLTDEDSSSPALKRTNSGAGFGAGATHPAGPHSAALQQLVASGAAKVVHPATGGRATATVAPQHRPAVNGHNTTQQQRQHSSHIQQQQQRISRHPAPLPAQQVVMVLGAKLPPPKPGLKIEIVQLPQQNRGVMLSWDIPQIQKEMGAYAKIAKYQLYAYQETAAPPATSLWKKIGDDVAAMPLPMACTLSHFLAGHKYHFAVRAVDEHSRIGPYSDPQSTYLG